MPADRSARDSSPPSAADLAAAVHDVRQMLAVITGRAGVMLEQTSDPSLAVHLRTMELAARDAGAMLARLVDGTDRRPGPAAADLRDAAVASTAMVLPPDPDRGLQADIAVPEGIVVAVSGQVLREVLNNLLFNSLAVMPDGGRITLTGAVTGDRVALRVADTGPGVDSGLADRVFEPGVTGSGRPGRGIGLAACRGLLAGFGAGISLAETSDAGAVFVLDLPLGTVVPAAAGNRAPLTGPAGPLRVLVVDDESAVRDMMTDLLGELGCEVSLAVDGPAARRILTTLPVDVAFLDQNLPGQSGVEIASWIREAFPATFLVLVTGWGNDALLQDTPGGLLDAAVEKPLTVGIVRDLLRLAMDQAGP